MLTQIDTTAFVSLHNHEPRGAGRWVFTIMVSRRSQGRDFTYAGPYSIAKMKALSEGNKVDAVLVVLDEFQSIPREDIIAEHRAER